MDSRFDAAVATALSALRNGQVILYPTDTIWGLGCDASDSAAVERINSLKGRSDSKNLIILIADERDILRYVAAPDTAVFDFWQLQDKPTTIIFENAIGLPDNLVGQDGSIAIRMVKDHFCRHLIKRLGAPVVSTSANISGEPAPATFAQISTVIKDRADHIVHWRQDDESTSPPSRIIKWSHKGDIQIIRP